MSRRGFTLVELMITVAIIGVLAAIAIPRFAAMSYKSKLAEAPVNVDGIMKAQVAYEATFDSFLAIETWHPAGKLTKEPKAWTPGSEFDELGWAPDGAVRCEYRSRTFNNRVRTLAQCDVDNDNNKARYKFDLMFKPRATELYGWQTDPDVY